jgi:hypothetical protein
LLPETARKTMTALLREEGSMRMISRGLLASGLVMGALAVQGMPQAQAASLIVVERATTDHGNAFL